jgi:D-3-phosphoglycerate dehydrogenase/(S)-sulfolactate dehydrogenase
METNARHRVLVADDLAPEAVALLRSRGLEVEVRTGLSPGALESAMAPFDGLLVRSATKVTAGLLQAAPRLRIVGRAGVGVDNVDLDAATRRGVLVVNAPGGSSVSVAELALGMMLALARHLPAASASLKAGRWEKRRFEGKELAGRTLGIVGVGNVGSALASRALAMGMRLVAYDPFIAPDAAARMGARLLALEDLWGEADVISLHVPLTDQTRGLVDRRVLARMREGALLVNCARGGLVDEAALAEALASGHLGGAAFDVFAEEPPPPDHPLLKLDNFLCTPHLGGSTVEAQSAVALTIAEKVAAFLLDGIVSGAVNAPALPKELLERLGPYLPLAERLGLLAAQLATGAPGAIAEVEVEVAGDLAASPTRPLAARALVGLLRGFLDVPVNEVNAAAVAKERGIALREVRSGEPQDYASLVTVRLRGPGGEVAVAGTVYGKRDPRIVRIGDFRLEGVPEGVALLCENLDLPGVVGNLGSALGEAGVNIARISLARREAGGTALSFVNVDRAPPPEVLERIRALPNVRWARAVVL